MRLCFGLDVMVEVSLVEIRNLLDIRNPMTPFMTTEKIIKFKKLLYMYMYMYMYTVVNYPNYICISLLAVYAILHCTRMTCTCMTIIKKLCSLKYKSLTITNNIIRKKT
jgi:hypothetical protein